MLSTQTIKNTGQASHYFLGQDNYYTEEQGLAQARSQWWGKGARSLGLSGPIDPQTFTQLLRGTLPNGQQLGKQDGDKLKHRPGFDLTFSAPKSVSLAALIGGDERILIAVERATDQALRLIERDLAKARVTRAGVTTYQKTGNLVVARFLHDLSRDADPQLHTHCVVMNMTQRRDGQWRSLASQMGRYDEQMPKTPEGFLEAVRHHKKYYGALFRAELAYEMTQLGYGVVKDQQGFFEITGISSAVIAAYSQRRQAITTFMQQQHFSGAKAAAVATLKTRPTKKQVDREDLITQWHAKAELFSVPAFQEIKETVEKALSTEKDPASGAPTLASVSKVRQAVHDAITHLSDTRIALRETEIIHHASKNILGEPVSIKELLHTVDALKKSGDLILLPTAPEFRGELHFTTATLLGYEKELLQAITKPHPHHKPLVLAKPLRAFLTAQTELTREQRQALCTLFSSQQQLLLLEGPAGSGKTYLLKPMMKLAKLGGYKPLLLTPSKAHSIDLEQQLRSVPTNLREWFKSLFVNKQCETVAGFLWRQANTLTLEAKLQKKPLIFLENATLLSSRQMRDLVHYTERSGGRLLAMGDAKSALTWQAGSPFTQMLAHGATAAHLTGNQRTINASLKTAVADTLRGNIQAAFDKIDQRIFSVENKEERLELMAAHYASLPAPIRHKTCVLMPTKTACEEINLIIREKLQANGGISSQETTMNALLPQTMTAVEQRYAKSYQPGQWIRFNEGYLSLRVQRGDYRQIVGIDAKRNQVLLANASGRVRPWNPSRVAMGKVEVFEAKTRAIASGDTLVWRRNDKTHALYNGSRVTLAAITDRQLKLSRENGKTLTLNRRQFSTSHFDYGYAFTPYQQYHTEPDTVIAYQSSVSRQSHQRRFYQLIGQAKHQAWIYTEDHTRLLKTLQQHTGDKTTAVDALLRETVLSAVTPSTSYATAHLKLLESAVQKALDRLQQAPTPASIAAEAVSYALAHLGEREAAFDHKEVVRTALQHTLGEVRLAHIEQAVLHAEKQGELIRGIYSTDGTRWTTQAALQREREIVALAQQDKGQLPKLLAAGTVTTYCQSNTLSQEQADTLRRLAAVTDRVVLIQGFAGTRKTTLLQHVQRLLQPSHHSSPPLLCLAPTHTAVKELKARGLEGQTLDHFLTQHRVSTTSLPSPPLQPWVIAVDESSMVSNRRLHDFLLAIQQLGARAVIVGDTKQYAAIESGKPFALLQQAGINTLFLQDITRQQDEILKAAVKATYQDRFADAFHILDKHIVEIGHHFVDSQSVDNRTERLEAIRDDYLARSPERRAHTLIVTLGNDDRVLQNALIREKLQAQGELFGDTLVSQVLVARNLTVVERARVDNYQMGDILRFNVADRALGIEKDQYWAVKEIYAQRNALVLARGDIIVLWQPPSFTAEKSAGMEVYQTATREIQAGDLIRWTRTDQALGLLSPELAKVEAIKGKHITVRPLTSRADGLKDGDDTLRITPHEARFQHWDHAYAMTGYSAQGKTIQEVIINAESFRPQLTSQPSFLVAITRAVINLTIYTDDKHALLEAIIRNRGEKRSALETVGEFPYHSKGESENTFQRATFTPQPAPALSSTKAATMADVAHSPISPSSSKSSPAKTPSLDAQRIYSMLVANTENLAKRLLGEPKATEAGQYRYGSHHGSLIITLNGDKRGLWHDFQTGEGGNLFKLIAQQHGLDVKSDFRAVLQASLHLLDTSEADLTARDSRTPKGQTLKAQKNQNPKSESLTPQQQKSLRYARQLARESQSLHNTLAERYLRERRHIRLEKFPSTLRFHPGVYSRKNDSIHPALLVIAKDDHNKTHAIQAIFLDAQTAQKANVAVKKQTWGIPSQGAVQLHKAAITSKQPVPTYLAEGAETTLSICAALGGGDVRITLGKSNFKNIDAKQTAQHIVLCLDNDGPRPEGDKLVDVAAQSLLKQGKQVWIAKPKETGQDFNDVLKTHGVAAVKKELDNAVPYEDYSAQRTSAVTLKSAVLDQQRLPLDAIKLPEQQTKNSLHKASIQRLIQTQDLSKENNSVPSHILSDQEKTPKKSDTTTTLSTTYTQGSITPTATENQPAPIEKIEKEREPEL